MKINDCELIYFNGLSSGGAKFSRSWETEIRQSLDGGEDRQGLRSQPLRRLPFQVVARNLSELSEARRIIQSGLESGRAATPLWGRGQGLALASSGPALTLDPECAYPFQPGDWIFIVETSSWRWEVAQIASVASLTALNLEDPLSSAFPIGSMVYPMLFGKLEVDEIQPISPVSAVFNLTVVEPLGSGSALSSEISCPVEAESFTLGNRTFCDGDLTLTLLDGCGGHRAIQWSALGYADSYQVAYSLDSGGPYTLFETTNDLESWIPRNFRYPVYFVVAAISGSTQILSNQVALPPITIEGCMRAFQERHVAAFGSTYTWPVEFAIGVFTPNEYPSDGWYDDDLDSGGAARETQLIQALSDCFYDSGILQRFVQVPSVDTLFEGADPNTPLAYFEDPSTSDRRDPFPDTAPVITELNRLSDLRLIADWFCPLKYLPIEYYPASYYSVDEILPHGKFIFSLFEIKDATALASDNCETQSQCVAYLQNGWNITDWYHTSSEPGYPFQAGVNAYIEAAEMPGGSILYVGQMRSVRYQMKMKVAGYGVAKLHLFQALTLELGIPPISAGQIPPCEVDGLYHATQAPVLLPGGSEYECPMYANQTPLIPESVGLETRWNLYAPLFLVEKLHEDWTHHA